MQKRLNRPSTLALTGSTLSACCASINAVLLTNRPGISDFAAGLSVGIPIGLSIILGGAALHRIRTEPTSL